METNAISLTILIVLSTLSWNGSEGAQNHPICIIGAGLGGLTLATRLQEKGHQVHIFERTGRFGGKLDTYRDEKGGLLLEMGPVYFQPDKSYTAVYAKKYNMTILPYKVQDMALFNPEIGSVLGPFTASRAQRTKLIEYSKRYASYYNHSELDEVGFPKIHLNSDLSKPFSVWLEERGLSPLAPIFYFAVTLLGYGDLKETPALYVLKYVQPEMLLPMLDASTPFATVAEGFSVLADRMAAPLRHKSTRHEVIQIARLKGKLELTFLVDEKSERTYTCSKAVITFIPLLSSVLPIVRDLSSEERNVLEMVKVNKYASSGHVIPSLKHWTYLGFVPKSIVPTGQNILPELVYPKGHGELLLFGKAGKGRNPQSYVAYSWLAGSYDSEGTERDERHYRLAALISC